MTQVHSTALVDPQAELDASVSVGPYTVIGPHVRVGAGTTIGAHCVIEGRTTVGRDNKIFQFSSLGAIPQDKKYAGEPTELVIGDRNVIREFCTFNLGVPGAGGVTRVGNDNWIMAYTHIAHDCHVDNHTTLANNTTLAGHVHLADWVTVGGLTGIHQFVSVGAHAMVGFASAVSQDVPPFMLVDGNPLAVRGFNVVGLRRRDFSATACGREADAPTAVPPGQDARRGACRHRRARKRNAGSLRRRSADGRLPRQFDARHRALT
jgi:UDP-N-acetylglucosamine acyltransferase